MAAFNNIGLETETLQNEVHLLHMNLKYMIIFIIIIPQNLHVYVIHRCSADNRMIFRILLSIYNVLLLIFLIVLTFFVTFVQSATFRREANLSLRAIGVAILPLPILATATLILRFKEFIVYIQPILWMHVTSTLLLPVLIMLVLFLPNVSLDGAWYI